MPRLFFANTRSPKRTPKSKTTALLLCLFTGTFGGHRFYVGKTGTAIAQIFTCGGAGIWTIIDLINIITGSFTDANGNKLQG